MLLTVSVHVVRIFVRYEERELKLEKQCMDGLCSHRWVVDP